MRSGESENREKERVSSRHSECDICMCDIPREVSLRRSQCEREPQVRSPQLADRARPKSLGDHRKA